MMTGVPDIMRWQARGAPYTRPCRLLLALVRAVAAGCRERGANAGVAEQAIVAERCGGAINGDGVEGDVAVRTT